MFPGATASRADAAYVVVGAPLDISTTFRPGTRFGPERIRRFARPFDDYDRRTDLRFSDCSVHDYGDVRAWDDAAEYLTWLSGELRAVVREGAVPLLLGGEHTVTAAGVEAVAPDVFVCLDAHLDLREAYDGNAYSHATVTRRVLEGRRDNGVDDADDDSAANGADAGVEADVGEVVVLGARTGSPEEWERAERDDVTVVAPEDVADFDLEAHLDGRSAYLSVDVDAADPGFAPGTGTPEPFGLEPREMRDVVRTVAPHAEGFDVVEVNDRDDGQAASLAAKLCREFVFSHTDG
ncbi:agmatinase family protein [Halobellus limi]|uniref:Agmatinase n=1 Tax=Halobellus limi TaxID=699433 RepID=A0A1H5V8R3_9EURY|nr:agmatinase family protein [Halobellus limi]QCC46787.1 agmatinase [Halobellus limi]SEF83584.1 agmatinase [Halobellus limi]